MGLTYRHNVELRAENTRTKDKEADARRNYQEAGSTIQAMLALVEDPRIEGVPRLVELQRDQREAALAFYERILQNTGSSDPSDPVIRLDTIRALGWASMLQHQLGRTDRAKGDVEKALGLIESLRSKRPTDNDFLWLEIDTQMKFGAYCLMLNLPNEAIAAAQKSVDLAKQLNGVLPDDPSYQELLANCYHNYGNALVKLHRRDEALSYYQKSNAIRESIDTAKFPGATWRLASSLVNEGMILWNTGKESRAEERFRRAEELLQSIPSERRNVGGNFDLLLGQVNVNWSGMLYLSGKFDEAIKRADAGLSRLERHLEIEPNDVTARNACLQLYGNRGHALSGLGKHRQSANEWTRVVELSAKPVPANHRIRLALELIYSGDLAGALAQVELIKPATDIAKEDCYNLGCVFARCAEASRDDKQLPPDDRARLVESRITDAMRWLRLAAEAGFFNDPTTRDQARIDPDLVILVQRDEFRQLIAPPETKP